MTEIAPRATHRPSAGVSAAGSRTEPAPSPHAGAGTRAGDGTTPSEDEETRERYRELLEELRTIIPGVQVLFGFLLTAPFSARFGDLDDTGRDLYVAVLVGVTLAIVVFLTPAAFHRMSSERDRDRRLRLSVVCTVIGLTLLAASIVTAVFMVSRFVFDSGLAAVVATVIGSAFAGCWYVLALLGRDRTS